MSSSENCPMLLEAIPDTRRVHLTLGKTSGCIGILAWLSQALRTAQIQKSSTIQGMEEGTDCKGGI